MRRARHAPRRVKSWTHQSTVLYSPPLQLAPHRRAMASAGAGGGAPPLALAEQLRSADASAAQSVYPPNQPVTRRRGELKPCRQWGARCPKPFANLVELLPSTDRPAIRTCSPDRRAAGGGSR
eukprot:SAG22_NODE_1691_length_3804_cov_34.905828_3_plen_123_part_00